MNEVGRLKRFRRRGRTRQEQAAILLDGLASKLTLVQGLGTDNLDDPDFRRTLVKAKDELERLILLCGRTAAIAWGEDIL